MALELSITVTEDATCDGLKFYETTGQYNGTTNLVGWDELGLIDAIPATSTILRAELDITIPGGTTPINFDLYPTFPSAVTPITADAAVSYAITETALGGTIPSGVYLFTYNVWNSLVDGTPVTATKSCYVLLTCAANCCIDKLFASVGTDSCTTCNELKLATAIEAQGYLCAAEKMLGCNRPTDAQLMVDKVTFLCNAENCKCT